MRNGIAWLFFDVGSTIVDERRAYAHRFEDIARFAGRPYAQVCETAMGFYRENKRGDLETAKHFGVALPPWHGEDEVLYGDAAGCLETLSHKYKIGIIANQTLGTADRLEKFGILKYIDLVVASAEEGVAKPDRRIFEIALHRANCKPANAMMIGDRVDNDIIPAKALGMRTAWIKQGFGQYWQVTEDREKADIVVESLTMLCDLLMSRQML